jgi:hypothetical protein
MGIRTRASVGHAYLTYMHMYSKRLMDVSSSVQELLTSWIGVGVVYLTYMHMYSKTDAYKFSAQELLTSRIGVGVVYLTYIHFIQYTFMYM